MNHHLDLLFKFFLIVDWLIWICHDFKLKSERKIKSIMVEILSNTGERVEFFFQDLNEATRFLQEFDFEKVPESQIEN